MGWIVVYFVNGVEIYKIKSKYSEVNEAPLFCLGNVSKKFSIDNIKKTGVYRYVYDFSVDYDSIDVWFNFSTSITWGFRESLASYSKRHINVFL